MGCVREGPPRTIEGDNDIVLQPSLSNVTGHEGRKFRCLVNVFRVSLKSDLLVYRYNLDVMSESGSTILDRTVCRAVIKAWALAPDSPILKKPYLYDGVHQMYALNKFESDYYECDIKVDIGTRSRSDFRELKMILKSAGTVRTSNLTDSNASFGEAKEALHYLNVGLRHFPSQMYFQVGASFYPMEDHSMVQELGNSGVNLYTGYYTSVRDLNCGTVMNLDVCHTLLYKAGPMIRIVAGLCGVRLDGEATIPRGSIEKVLDYFKGLKLSSVYPSGDKRSYRVFGISSKPVSEIQFNFNGKNVSVMKYFEERYKCTFSYPIMQCFNSSRRPGQEAWIPIEFASLCQKQLYRRALTAEQSRQMIAATCQSPSLRRDKVLKAYERMKSPDCLYDTFKFEVQSQMMEVGARVLPPQEIKFHERSIMPTSTPLNGFWNMRDKIFSLPVRLNSWIVVSFMNTRIMPMDSLMKFAESLTRVLSDQGLGVPCIRPNRIFCAPECERDPSLATDRFTEIAKSVPGLEFAVCVLPKTNTTAVYCALKLSSDTIVGVPTQCVSADNVRRCSMGVLSNIGLKINLKLDGVNCILNQKVEAVSSCPTMVIGADVSHPKSQSSASLPSVASVVGSINSTCSVYRAYVKPQMPQTETFVDLKDQVLALMKDFLKKNNVGPNRIIYIRDGISEGDIEYATKTELNSIILAARALKPTWRPKVTYISCNKRHHMVFSPMDEDLNKSSSGFAAGERDVAQEFPRGNLPPGTVIDTDVTSKGYKNFYIIPHSGIKGTSRAVHYRVLHDENDLSYSQLERMVFQLCHLYGRSTSIVSYAAPVYYAHVVSKRAITWYSALRASGKRWSSMQEGMRAGKSMSILEDVFIHPKLNGKLWFV